MKPSTVYPIHVFFPKLKMDTKNFESSFYVFCTQTFTMDVLCYNLLILEVTICIRRQLWQYHIPKVLPLLPDKYLRTYYIQGYKTSN